jgi:hypothetical protein
VSKIKIAELEHRTEFAQFEFSGEEARALLRLARAAKARSEVWTRETYAAVADALDAFDFEDAQQATAMQQIREYGLACAWAAAGECPGGIQKEYLEAAVAEVPLPGELTRAKDNAK